MVRLLRKWNPFYHIYRWTDVQKILGSDLTKTNYLTKSDFTEDFDKQLKNNGWNLIDSGRTKTIDYNEIFRAYVKEIDLKDVVELSKNTTETRTEIGLWQNKNQSQPVCYIKL